MSLKKLSILAFVACAMLGLASSAFGCTVCFGESDHPIVKGAEASVMFMVGVTYTVLGGGVVSFFLLRRRARRLAEQNALASPQANVVAPEERQPKISLDAEPQGAYRQ